MNLLRRIVAIAFWIEIAMEVIAGHASAEHFNAGDFNDAMALGRIKTCRFGIKNNLPHGYALPMPRLARASARSFSGCPAWPLTHSHWI